jgi:hypothetical protein
MPKQEVFFEQQIGERRIEVLKSYDQAYAREASRTWMRKRSSSFGQHSSQRRYMIRLVFLRWAIPKGRVRLFSGMSCWGTPHETEIYVR